MSGQRPFDTVPHQKAHEVLIQYKIDEALEGFEVPEGGGESPVSLLATYVSGNEPDISIEGAPSVFTMTSDPLPTTGHVWILFDFPYLSDNAQNFEAKIELGDDASDIQATLEAKFIEMGLNRAIEVTGGPIETDPVVISVVGNFEISLSDSTGDGVYTFEKDFELQGIEPTDLFQLDVADDVVVTDIWATAIGLFESGESPHFRITANVTEPFRSFCYGTTIEDNVLGLETTEDEDKSLVVYRLGSPFGQPSIIPFRTDPELPLYLAVVSDGHGEGYVRFYGNCVEMSTGGV